MMLSKEQMLKELMDAYEFFQQAEDTEYIYETRRNLLEEERGTLEKPPVSFYILFVFVPLYVLSLFRRLAMRPMTVLLFVILVVGLLIAKPVYKKTSHYAKRLKEFKDKEEALKDLEGTVILNCYNNRGSVSFLSKEYWNTDAIGSMIGYLKNGRAITVADMVNLYENELHQRRMENIQMEILREEKLQTEAAQNPQYIYIQRY